MSHSFSVSLLSDPIRLASTYRELIGRLVRRGELRGLITYETNTHHPTSEIADLEDGLSQSRLEAISDSSQAVCAFILYEHLSGSRDTLDVHLLGRRFRPEIVARQGNCYISGNLNEIHRPIQFDESLGATLQVSPRAKERLQTLGLDCNVVDLAIGNAVDFFWNACGGDDSSVLDAYAYVGVELTSASACCMVYHREPARYQRDLLEIMERLLDHQPRRMTTITEWSVVSSALAQTAKQVLDAIYNGCRELDESCSRELLEFYAKGKELDGTTMRSAIWEIPGLVPGVVCYDADNDGIVLATEPLGYLRTAFEIFASRLSAE